MTGWNFFFTLLGVSTFTAQIFRIVDYIERPRDRRRQNVHSTWKFRKS